MNKMKTRLLIIIVFAILLMMSLIVVSHMETIQKEVWYMSGKYDRDPNAPNLMPSLDYDYGLMYVVVLEVFGVIGVIIFGINFVIGRIRK